MPSQPIVVLLFLLAFLLLVIITHRLYKARMNSEQSRKFLHISGGILGLLLPVFIHSHWWVLLLAALSFLLLLFTWLFKQLPAVHQTKRYSLGSLLFPIPVYGCFLAAATTGNFLLFYIPISLLTFSDTLAEWGGKRWGHATPSFFGGQKTLAGSLCFALSALIICLLWLIPAFHLPVSKAVAISLLTSLATTIAEAISLKGWDNVTVPAAALGVLTGLLP